MRKLAGNIAIKFNFLRFYHSGFGELVISEILIYI